MRILVANKHAYRLGGVDSHCWLLIEGLRERGHDVFVLAGQHELNVEISGVFVPPRGGKSSLLPTLWNRSAAGAMRAAIERFRPDVVHSHLLYPQLSVAPLAVARRAGVPIVQTLHTYELLSANYASISGEWIDRGDQRTADRVRNTATFPVRRFAHTRLVDAYIAVSKFVADQHARIGIAAEVIPNAVAVDEGPKRAGFAQRQGIVFAGRLVPEKGVLDVVDVARRLPHIPVTLVGAGPMWPQVRREAERLPNLVCAGWVQSAQMQEHLGAARVLVMPSRCEETSGIAALEALACGTPVVALPRGGLAEIVRESGAGQLVSSGGSELASACERLHQDGTRWQELSQRGLEAVADRYSVAHWLDRTESVYARAARRRAARS